MTSAARPPLAGVTGYHWLVFALASLGWMFDCTGQRIFVLSREPALRELLGADASEGDVRYWGGIATFILMVGWATGGILFGVVSDRYGRVKAMVATLVAFTVFSALSALARNSTEFLLYRFPSGLGVGGMFGAATTLLAESVPAHFRTIALGSMQAVSAFGNMLAAGLSVWVGPGRESLWGPFSGWQVLFFLGALPVLLAVPMMLLLQEPESWRKARAAEPEGGRASRTGRVSDLFTDRRLRHNTLTGVCLGLSGMVGLWGLAFFSPELITTAFKARPLEAREVLDPPRIARVLRGGADSRLELPLLEPVSRRLDPDVRARLHGWDGTAPLPHDLAASLVEELDRLIHGDGFGTPPSPGQDPDAVAFQNRQWLEKQLPGAIAELKPAIDRMRGRGMVLQDLGSLLGMFAFTFFAVRFSRRAAFLVAFLMCLFTVASVFYGLDQESEIYWMLPLLGFATMACFAGYAIYFPELFPTRLRGTGVGFCYNTVRYLAAPFPFLLGWLSTMLPFRTVAIAMSAIYVVGILALIRAPETKGAPLPE